MSPSTTVVAIPDAVCVYCASSMGNEPEFREAAESLGRAIANQKRTLVYGGGNRGLMGAVSAACRDAGGKTLGVIPRTIAEGGGEGSRKEEVMSIVAAETIVVDSMHQRKMIMAESADAGFIGLPGGFGTLEEVLEAITWTQLGIQKKPVVLLNVKGYYTPIRQLVQGGVTAGLIKPGYSGIVQIVDKPEDDATFDWGEAALKALANWAPPREGPLYTTWKSPLAES
ncbi:hypothetical protein DL93DRAFT_2072437 [Clavulina sp. PMI_390]|nr:hypothetical protein DL93DRAFT_2072437 [Clavulina sp. PMI_390]